MKNKIEEIRKERGLSITEFSDELNISRSALQAILLCKANPRMDTDDMSLQNAASCHVPLRQKNPEQDNISSDKRRQRL